MNEEHETLHVKQQFTYTKRWLSIYETDWSRQINMNGLSNLQTSIFEWKVLWNSGEINTLT